MKTRNSKDAARDLYNNSNIRSLIMDDPTRVFSTEQLTEILSSFKTAAKARRRYGAARGREQMAQLCVLAANLFGGQPAVDEVGSRMAAQQSTNANHIAHERAWAAYSECQKIDAYEELVTELQRRFPTNEAVAACFKHLGGSGSLPKMTRAYGRIHRIAQMIWNSKVDNEAMMSACRATRMPDLDSLEPLPIPETTEAEPTPKKRANRGRATRPATPSTQEAATRTREQIEQRIAELTTELRGLNSELTMLPAARLTRKQMFNKYEVAVFSLKGRACGIERWLRNHIDRKDLRTFRDAFAAGITMERGDSSYKIIATHLAQIHQTYGIQ